MTLRYLTVAVPAIEAPLLPTFIFLTYACTYADDFFATESERLRYH